jgi:tetratricopeptide (TPR) repeat protein
MAHCPYRQTRSAATRVGASHSWFHTAKRIQASSRGGPLNAPSYGFYELRLAKFQVQCEHPCELVDYGGLQRFELRDTEGLPEQLDYLGRQAWYYVEFEKSKQALIWIDRMLKVYPTSSFAYQLRGRYAERRRQWQKAADAYDTGAKLLETGQDALRRQPRGIDDDGSALD